MSWFNNVSGVSLDNPDQKKQETRTESPSTSASLFDSELEVSPEDMGLAVGHADNDDSYAVQPKVKTTVDILEEMFECGGALDVIVDYCNKNGLVLDNLINENTTDAIYFEYFI